jgi:hypothetical protein
MKIYKVYLSFKILEYNLRIVFSSKIPFLLQVKQFKIDEKRDP